MNSLGGAAVYPESRVHAVHEHEAGVAAGDLGQEEAGPAQHQREAETQPHNYQCISDTGGDSQLTRSGSLYAKSFIISSPNGQERRKGYTEETPTMLRTLTLI